LKAQTAVDEWIDGREAARLLGLSERHVNRRAAAGYIRKRTLPRKPNEKGSTVVYSYDDVMGLKDGNPTLHEVEKPAPPAKRATAEAMLTAAPQAETLRGLAEYLSVLTANVTALNAPPVSSDTGKPWLTLAEASEFSGLPVAYLRKEARRSLQMPLFPTPGEAPHTFVVRNVGSLTNERFMFSRESLKG
jgi:hypothetical protein